jgi:hypothetical protein
MPVQCTCLQCGGAFTVRPSRIRVGTGKYCSYACSDAAKLTLVERPCVICSTSFMVRAAKKQECCGTRCALRLVQNRKRTPLNVRFWLKVSKDGPVPAHRPELGPCWPWTGRTGSHGYGLIRRGEGDYANLEAHRASWELHRGQIMDGLWVLHHCDNRPCVRPDHLFLGTSPDNHADMVSKGRQARGEKTNTARLTESQVLEIRQRRASGERQTDLAREFSVSVNTIGNIFRRETWAHLP